MTGTLPDSVTDLRDVIRGMNISGLTTNVFGRFPDTGLTFPAARVYRTGGGPQPGTEAVIDDGRLTVEVVAGDAKGRNAADQIARVLLTRLQTLPAGTVQGGTKFLDCSVIAYLPVPEPDSTQIRHLIEVAVTCVAATG